MEKINYNQINAFKNFYFEDSYLLNIECESNHVSLNVLIVLTPTHPLYQSPLEGEQYCYKNININFLGAKDVQWLRKNLKKIPSELDSVEDYGNIDVLCRVGKKYYIEGEWGALEFISEEPKVSYLNF